MPSIRMVLLVCTVALVLAACRTQQAVVTPKSNVAQQASNSALDVPIESIAATVPGCAILDKDFPGLRTHAMYAFFKAMTLHQIAALSHGRMTPDMMAQARSDMSALSFVAAARPVHQADIDDLEPTASLGDTHRN